MAAGWLRRKHADAMTVQFYDVDSFQTQQEFAAIVAAINEQRMALPVVEIDGELTPLLWANEWAIVQVVEDALMAARAAKRRVKS